MIKSAKTFHKILFLMVFWKLNKFRNCFSQNYSLKIEFLLENGFQNIELVKESSIRNSLYLQAFFYYFCFIYYLLVLCKYFGSHDSYFCHFTYPKIRSNLKI